MHGHCFQAGGSNKLASVDVGTPRLSHACIRPNRLGSSRGTVLGFGGHCGGVAGLVGEPGGVVDPLLEPMPRRRKRMLGAAMTVAVGSVFRDRKRCLVADGHEQPSPGLLSAWCGEAMSRGFEGMMRAALEGSMGQPAPSGLRAKGGGVVGGSVPCARCESERPVATGESCGRRCSPISLAPGGGLDAVDAVAFVLRGDGYRCGPVDEGPALRRSGEGGCLRERRKVVERVGVGILERGQGRWGEAAGRAASGPSRRKNGARALVRARRRRQAFSAEHPRLC